MDWTTVLATALGGVLALAGGFAGQWWEERRTVSQEHRARAEEQRIWRRSQLLSAYTRFDAALSRVLDQTRDAIHNPPPSPISLEELDAAGLNLNLFASEQLQEKTDSVRRELSRWGRAHMNWNERQRERDSARDRGLPVAPLDLNGETVRKAMKELRAQLRADLAIAEVAQETADRRYDGH